jgi:hypothetical protein
MFVTGVQTCALPISRDLGEGERKPGTADRFSGHRRPGGDGRGSWTMRQQRDLSEMGPGSECGDNLSVPADLDLTVQQDDELASFVTLASELITSGDLEMRGQLRDDETLVLGQCGKERNLRESLLEILKAVHQASLPVESLL